MAFFTILIPPGLSDSEYRRALRASSPGFSARRRDHAELLRTARFVNVHEIDVTADYLRVARAWLESRQRHAEELRKVDGEEAVAESLENNRTSVEAIEAGLHRRSLFVAERPR